LNKRSRPIRDFARGRREGTGSFGENGREHRGMSRSRREFGFTVIELAITVVLIGVSLGIASLYYGRTQKDLSMKSAVSEVESIMERAYNIAMQEGVEVYVQFWDDMGTHANRCAIYRVYPDGTDEHADDEPTEPPPSGVTADTDGSGHYWFKLANGGIDVQDPVTLLFRRDGSLVTVSSTEGGMSVTLVGSGQTRTVSINDRGEISS
jgi:type II secretory pathway pseudopilin PulG